MKPANFPEANMILAKDQPEYVPLPVFRDTQGVVMSCWKMNLWERIYVLFTGRIWCIQLTFNHPLQPQLAQVYKFPITKDEKPC